MSTSLRLSSSLIILSYVLLWGAGKSALTYFPLEDPRDVLDLLARVLL
jgi:hypothetical protein